LTAVDRPLPRLTIDQSHSIEPKAEAIVLSVLNVQEAYAKALLVDRDALQAAQTSGDILGAHRLLLDALATDVREMCARVRVGLGAEADPIAAVRAVDHAARRGR
jgi:L-rhamnose isomerase/sugar isomerase